MDRLAIGAVISPEITSQMFGVKLGRENGPRDVNAYSTAFDYLGVKAVRFSYDVDVGMYNVADKYISTADALSFAASRGDGVTLCIVAKNLFEPDSDNNIFTPRDVDFQKVAEIKNQIASLLSSGSIVGDSNSAQIINAIELGNEYWGLGGMTSQEYGKLVNILAKAVGEAIDDSGISAALSPKVLVQMGSPYSIEFDSDQTNSPYNAFSWLDAIRQSNLDIINQIVDVDAKSSITGLVEHYYYTQTGDGFNFDSSAVRYIDRDWSIWAANGFGDRELHITEWNNKLNNPAQFGLKGAGVVLEMLESMLRLGVDAATIWPFQHNQSRLVDTLMLDSDGTPRLTPRGAAFKLMSESLVGSSLVESNINTSSGFDYELNAFSHGNQYTLFIFSRADHDIDIDIDLSAYASLGAEISGVKVGVDASTADGKYVSDGKEYSVPLYQDPDALAILTETNYVTEKGALTIKLAPYEIIRLTLSTDGPVTRIGTEFADTFSGGNGDDTIMGCGGSDIIMALAGSDNVNGGSGRDNISLGHGNDFSDGGSGDDYIAGDFGNDQILGGYGADRLFGDSGNDILTGGRGRDQIRGGIGADRLYGGQEDDTLLGDDGRDTLDGGLGADYLDGGSGDDTFIIDNRLDRATGAAGVDRVVSSSVSLSLSSGKFKGVENAALDGYANLSLIGSADGNTLIGNGGNNYISGGVGDDTVSGGRGNDTLLGGAGRDVFVFNTALSAKNVDRVVDFDTNADTFRLWTGIFSDGPLGIMGTRSFSANSSGKALDRFDRVIYETDTGHLYFDRDGTGAADRQLVATLASHLSLSASDFYLY